MHGPQLLVKVPTIVILKDQTHPNNV